MNKENNSVEAKLQAIVKDVDDEDDKILSEINSLTAQLVSKINEYTHRGNTDVSFLFALCDKQKNTLSTTLSGDSLSLCKSLLYAMLDKSDEVHEHRGECLFDLFINTAFNAAIHNEKYHKIATAISKQFVMESFLRDMLARLKNLGDMPDKDE